MQVKGCERKFLLPNWVKGYRKYLLLLQVMEMKSRVQLYASGAESYFSPKFDFDLPRVREKEMCPLMAQEWLVIDCLLHFRLACFWWISRLVLYFGSNRPFHLPLVAWNCRFELKVQIAKYKSRRWGQEKRRNQRLEIVIREWKELFFYVSHMPVVRVTKF